LWHLPLDLLHPISVTINRSRPISVINPFQNFVIFWGWYIFSETFELATELSKYFFKRVGVAVLDLGYPSNFATFGDLFDESPALLLKHPNRVHKMFHHDDIHRRRFYRTYPYLYHKCGNIVIFRLYSLYSPENQDYQKIIHF